MNEIERFGMLLTRTGVSWPRGVLGSEARSFARAVAAGAGPDVLADLRHATAAAHWPELRLAVGAALARHGPEESDPTLADALELILDERPDNPLALALAEEAGRSLAGVHDRVQERMVVLDARLAVDGPGEADVALIVGAIVVDLLDLSPGDYEDEIAAYVGGDESERARRELARETGDEEIRSWAREELRVVVHDDAPVATSALAALTAPPVPEDPADDAVWIATILALVEDAVELAVITEPPEDG
jgi:hypothetical protein